MNPEFVNREEIKLNDSQTHMVISGWGKGVYENSVVEKITYLSDGLKVKGYVAYPKIFENQKFPCVIWNRGGFKEKGSIDKFTARGIFGQLASWGYTVFATQYRGNAGSEGREEFGGKDINDILNLMSIAKELIFTDTDKWGIEGWSRGGMMSLLTLLKSSNFKCAILIAAISNLKNYMDSDPEKKSFYQTFFQNSFDEEVDKRRIIDKVDKLPEIPYLIMHGRKDKTVPYKQSVELADKLTNRGIINKLILFEEGEHFLKKYRTEVDEQRRLWYDKYLKGL